MPFDPFRPSKHRRGPASRNVVTVGADPSVVVAVVVSPSSLSAAPGGSSPLGASPRNYLNQEIASKTVSWQSSNTAVATITGTGYNVTVNFVGTGSCLLTATVDGIAGTCSVLVSVATAGSYPNRSPGLSTLVSVLCQAMTTNPSSGLQDMPLITVGQSAGLTIHGFGGVQLISASGNPSGNGSNAFRIIWKDGMPAGDGPITWRLWNQAPTGPTKNVFNHVYVSMWMRLTTGTQNDGLWDVQAVGDKIHYCAYGGNGEPGQDNQSFIMLDGTGTTDRLSGHRIHHWISAAADLDCGSQETPNNLNDGRIIPSNTWFQYEAEWQIESSPITGVNCTQFGNGTNGILRQWIRLAGDTPVQTQNRTDMKYQDLRHNFTGGFYAYVLAPIFGGTGQRNKLGDDYLDIGDILVAAA